jgi:pilus assembly protein Flp/PilA
MFKFLVRLVREENGPTAVEYAVLLALIMGSIIGVIGSVGAQTGGMWGNNSSRMIDAGLGGSS